MQPAVPLLRILSMRAMLMLVVQVVTIRRAIQVRNTGVGVVVAADAVVIPAT